MEERKKSLRIISKEFSFDSKRQEVALNRKHRKLRTFFIPPSFFHPSIQLSILSGFPIKLSDMKLSRTSGDFIPSIDQTEKQLLVFVQNDVFLIFSEQIGSVNLRKALPSMTYPPMNHPPMAPIS